MIQYPEIHQKGWGSEKWVANNEKYCGKILHFFKGKKCSWHYHVEKSEHFYIQSGKLELTYGWKDNILFAQTIILEPGDVFEVPVGMRHQMKALLETDMFEFSTEHKESDSIRIAKGD